MPEDIFFLKKAYEIAHESDDPKAKIYHNSAVGCVIVRYDKILAQSANILPTKIANSKAIYESIKHNRLFFIEHAERAAIFQAYNAGVNISQSTVYCTRFPCSDCARALIASNITRLILPQSAENEPSDSIWIESQKAAKLLFHEADIKVDFLDITID